MRAHVLAAKKNRLNGLKSEVEALEEQLAKKRKKILELKLELILLGHSLEDM